MAERDVMLSETGVASLRRFDGVSIIFHWFTLGLLILVFASAWSLAWTDAGSERILLMIHRSAGVLVWAITLARLLWKVTLAETPGLPLTLSRHQRWVARATQSAMYLLLIVQPLTGFGQSVARGKPFPLIGITVPSLMSHAKALTHVFDRIHETSATLLLGIVGLHSCAALFHGLILRDGVLRSMLPQSKIRAPQ